MKTHGTERAVCLCSPISKKVNFGGQSQITEEQAHNFTGASWINTTTKTTFVFGEILSLC